MRTLKISTKGIYGLKALVDLAIYSKEDIVTLKSISERQNISERYLEQIFSLLRKSKIIVGKKGSQGGYSLDVNPEDTTIYTVLKALEGDFLQMSSVESDDKLDKVLEELVWNKLDESITNFLCSVTLQDLIDEYKKDEKDPFMYYI